MSKIILSIFLYVAMSCVSSAATPTTTRVSQFSNNKVAVWETTIYPGTDQTLKTHRHEHDRVVIALSDGLLKIINDKDKVHYLKLKKDHAYYLLKDIPDELHRDENVSSHPIKVIVVELKN